MINTKELLEKLESDIEKNIHQPVLDAIDNAAYNGLSQNDIGLLVQSACQHFDESFLRELLSRHPDLLVQNRYGWTAAHVLAYLGKTEGIDILGQYSKATGHDVGFYSATGTAMVGLLPHITKAEEEYHQLTPLQFARMMGKNDCAKKIEEYLTILGEKAPTQPLQMRLWKAVVGRDLGKLKNLLVEIKSHPKSKEILNYFIPATIQTMSDGSNSWVPTISEADKKELEEIDIQYQVERFRNRWFAEDNTSLLYTLSVEKLDFAFALLEAGSNPFIQNKFGISICYMIAMFHSDTAERKVAFLRRAKEMYPREFEIDINRNYNEANWARSNMSELALCQAKNPDVHIFIKGWKDLGGKNIYKENHAMWGHAFLSPYITEIMKVIPEEFTLEKLLTETSEEGTSFISSTNSSKPEASQIFYKICESEGKLNLWRSKGPDFLMSILNECGINTCKTTEDAQKAALAFKLYIEKGIEILAFPHKSYNIISRIKGQLESLNPTSNETILRKRYGCELLTLLKNASAPAEKEANEIFTKSMAEVDILLAKFAPECQFQSGTVLSGTVPPLIFNQNAVNTNSASSAVNPGVALGVANTTVVNPIQNPPTQNPKPTI